ncbi:MAG: type IVB secretion system apparatus protein IcmL/DotI [Francisellaceae bacterium]
MPSALQQVKMRNDFYRDNFRRIALILLISILMNILLLAGFIIALGMQPNPKYFATTADGQIIKLNALNQPVTNDGSVISWVSRVIPDINTLDFLNYRSEINAKRQYFTSFGWKQYLKAFQPIIDKVIHGQYILSATQTDVPIITQKGLIDGVYSWRVELPLLITYQKGNDKDVEHVIWNLLIQRSNEHESSPYGISQIIQKQQDNT